MEKDKQRALSAWLKAQSKLAKRWLLLSVGLAFVSALLLVGQAALIASILHALIIEHVDKSTLVTQFILLAVVICFRAACSWGKETAGFRCGEEIRRHMRRLILEKLNTLGPAFIQGKPAGTWATLILEQVEEMQDFFARYLPQMAIAVMVPFIILVAVFPVNWAAGLIFLLTAPLVPLFMALVGMKAAEANRKNFKALQRLSGFFYDRLRGLATIRLFDRADAEAKQLEYASEDFRRRTMEVLRLAFLSSAVLEFFTALSIAITAVYFGFSYIGELNFGHYGITITLFTGLFVLILAPEFYQPLRDLGTFYHAKAQAIGAAESIVEFLDTNAEGSAKGNTTLPSPDAVSISAENLEVFSPDGIQLAGPLNFHISAGEKIALVGPSGAGKTSLVNAILGFLPYRGSLTINGIEMSSLSQESWHREISWVGQNPMLVHGSVRENLCLSRPDVDSETLAKAVKNAYADEFINRLEKGYEHHVGDRACGVSVGQAQRIAVARALIQDGNFWLLDEPTASLDANSEKLVANSLSQAIQQKTSLTVTHRLAQLADKGQVWVMDKGQLVQQGKLDEISTSGLLKEMITAVDKGDIDA